MEAIELRKRIKKKKPEFIRRRTKGHQAKMRLHRRGYKRSVEVGFGSPKSVTGLHGSGLRERVVSRPADIEKLSKEEGIVVSARVGEKKKIEILKKAKEKGAKVLNIRNIDAYIKESEDKIKEKKESKVKSVKKKEEKKKEIEKKAKEKKGEGLADKVTEEEKKDQEKKEKDKLLIKQEK